MNYHLFGDKYLEVPNEPDAFAINYYLREDAAGEAKITVSNSAGTQVRQVNGPAKRGFNRALVPLGGGGRGAAAVAPLLVGDYVVKLEVAGATLTKPARVRARIQ
jgi:hypothetical protein